MALVDQANLALDEGFRRRVMAAIYVAAQDVLNEDPSTEAHEKRVALAKTVFQGGPYSMLDQFAWAVVANPAITNAATDNDVQFTVNSNWNAIAGVV